MKTYKIYMYDKKEDFKLYVHALLFGTDGVSFYPALVEEMAGIYEEDKAKSAKDMLNQKKKDDNIYFEIEEITNE